VRRAREAWEKIGDEPSALIADYNMGQTLADQGRVDEAEPLLRRVSEVWRTLGNDIRIALVASALGRTLARAGRHDEARELLEEARVVFGREEEWVELLTTEARMMESLVLEGGNDDALPRTDALIDRAERIDGVSVQTAMLHRLRGWALLQNAELDAAEASFTTSLAILRSPASNFGIESVDYDTALTLHALVQVRRLTGGRVEDLELERDAIVARLGLVSLAEPSR
jgi:tetratricopeptide (TPR) repeat protein